MRTFLRSAAVVAAGAVVTTTLAAPAHADAADRGGAWLQSQLTDGAVPGDFKEGLTVDFGFAFHELGMTGPRTEVSDAMADRVASYTGEGTEVYAGPTAKLLEFARRSGADTRAYGGFDLVERLQRRVVATGNLAGRLEDQSQFGDFANTIGQAFAVPGLARAGVVRKARKATRFLLDQQCPGGYFRLNFSPKGHQDQSCDAVRRGNRKAPDTDATAFAVMGLRTLPQAQRTAATRRAARQAVAWLERTQKANGSFGGGVDTEASNTNSTGLAAWALGEAGACPAARRAARWVRDLQVGDASGTPLEGETGAIAYNRAAYDAAESAGITDGSRDQWQRATSQAAPGLRFVGGC